MADTVNPTSNRSVSVGGNMTGSVIQTGDQNVASVQYQQATLPPPESVDIRAELAILRELLVQIDSPDKRKIENALSDAEDELSKPEPDKDEVGQALDRALKYTKRAEGFAKVMGTLKPHIASAASWLGSNWHSILAVVGLVV